MATYDEPRQFPAGIPYVIVNGELVVDGGEHTGRAARTCACGEVARTDEREPIRSARCRRVDRAASPGAIRRNDR